MTQVIFVMERKRRIYWDGSSSLLKSHGRFESEEEAYDHTKRSRVVSI